MKDYYSILGVTQEADLDLIKATYLSLSKIYHPDIYKGDKKFAEGKMKELNEAYNCLKDKNKRKKYNADLKTKVNIDEESQKNDFDQEIFEKTIKDDWKVIINYFPEIELEKEYLKKLNINLSFKFQVYLITLKQTSKWKTWSKLLVDDFFTRHFGESLKLHRFMETILLSNNIVLFNKISNDLRVIGSANSDFILEKIKSKYSSELSKIEIGDEKIRLLIKPWSEIFHHHKYMTVREKNLEQEKKVNLYLFASLIFFCLFIFSSLNAEIILMIIFLLISIISYFVARGNNYDAFGNNFHSIKNFTIPLSLIKNLSPLNMVYFFILSMIGIGILIAYFIHS